MLLRVENGVEIKKKKNQKQTLTIQKQEELYGRL